ncbi:MAG: hypothetical protein ACI4WF_00960 [Bacilli bacterium]
MGKVNLNVKYCLINEEDEYNIKGIYQNNIIKFFDKDNKMILDKTNNVLTRITNDEKIEFNFLKNTCLITDLKEKIKVNLEINVLELINEDNYFLVNYEIENNKFKLIIKII